MSANSPACFRRSWRKAPEPAPEMEPLANATATRELSPLGYLLALIAAVATICVIGLPLMFVYAALPCDHSLYDHDHYLGYCASKGFGDYEHGAVAYGLVPEVIERLREADVVFLGNSVMQASISTEASADYFKRIGRKFYAFGYGYAETSVFPEEILARHALSPQVVVIDADPFFAPSASLPGRDTLAGGLVSRLRYAIKFAFHSFHAPVCAALPWLCRPATPLDTDFRAISDGRWVRFHSEPASDWHEIPAIRHRPIPETDLAQEIRIANHFIDRLGLDRRCVILTGVPTPRTNAEVSAARLAAALGTPLVQPSVPGLIVYDDVHLTLPSAERWSTALMAAIDPIIQTCLAAKPKAAGG